MQTEVWGFGEEDPEVYAALRPLGLDRLLTRHAITLLEDSLSR